MPLNRREFLRSAAGAAIGSALLGPTAATEPSPPPLGYRRLGRTGLNVSVVSFGGHAAFRGYLVSEAIERGVNLIHTSPFYARGQGMKVFGQVLRTLRHKVYLAVKIPPEARVVDRCLQVLKTDYIDFIIPGVQSLAQLRPNIIEDFNKRKKEGKARFLGIACHSNIPKVLAKALEMDCFDVALLAYNLANRKDLAPLLAEAKRRDVGVVAMKSLLGLTAANGGPPSLDLAAATIRDMLSDTRLASVLKRMGNEEEVDALTKLMHTKLGRAEPRVRELETRVAAAACGMCGACSDCPQGVRIADILRYAYYAADSDAVHQAYGPEAYRRLPRGQSFEACTGCGECERVCPKGLNIVEQLAAAHQRLA